MKNKWRIWDKNQSYGDLFFDRATGKEPEMESSKAVGKLVKKYIKPNQTILDVGCGGGHYLVSLDRIIDVPFHYKGIDATAYYIEKAKKAFSKKSTGSIPSNRLTAEFFQGDIFKLPVRDCYADIVMCNNVLLHLPSIRKPISELIRVSKKYIIIRTLIGITSFRIKQINKPEKYDEAGEPENYHYFNIYSETFVENLIKSICKIKSFTSFDDTDFDADLLGVSNYKNRKIPDDLTNMLQNMQVNNYIIQPWKFLIIEKK